MKDEHLELFIDLLVEKVKELNCELADVKAKLAAPVNDETYCADLKKKYDTLKADYEVLQEHLAQLQSNFDKMKASVPAKTTGADNAYKLMVEYAKANGFKFARLGVMKAFIEGKAKDGKAADSAEKPKQEESVSAEIETVPGNRIEAPVEGKPEKVSREHTIEMGGKCPHGECQPNGAKATVGGLYCYKKCPWFTDIDRDQNFVTCHKR